MVTYPTSSVSSHDMLVYPTSTNTDIFRVYYLRVMKKWNGSLWLFFSGLLISCYGTGGFQTSRWEHHTDPPPTFHPWVVLIGLSLIAVALWVHYRGRERDYPKSGL